MNAAEWWDRFHGIHNADCHEWYGLGDRALSDLVREGHASMQSGSCLHVGVGTSELGDILAELGLDVHNIDFSAAAIEMQQARQAAVLAQVGSEADPGSGAAQAQSQAREAMARQRYSVADASNLDPSWTDAFSLVVDKGTLDAMLADRSEDSLAIGARAVGEWIRVCRWRPRNTDDGRAGAETTDVASPGSTEPAFAHVIIGSMIPPSVRVPDLRRFVGLWLVERYRQPVECVVVEEQQQALDGGSAARSSDGRALWPLGRPATIAAADVTQGELTGAQAPADDGHASAQDQADGQAHGQAQANAQGEPVAGLEPARAWLRVHTVPEPPLEKPSQAAWWWYELLVAK